MGKPRAFAQAAAKELEGKTVKLFARGGAGGKLFGSVSTKEIAEAIQAGKPVVITPEVDNNVVLSSRNIPGVVTTTARMLSVYDLVNAKYLVIDKSALDTIEEVYA